MEWERAGGVRTVTRVGLVVVAIVAGTVRADTITLKNGLVYHGVIIEENTTRTIDDGLKLLILRDTKIKQVEPAAPERLESFHIDQPILVHGGVMPAYAFNIKAGPWDEHGRRSFEYTGPRSSTVRMTQAIYDINPRVARVRGVDGFWQGQLPLSQVPKKLVLGLLGRADRKDQAERLKVGRFLIQAEWYPEALAELEQIGLDFPEVTETVRLVKSSVQELQARALLAEIATRRRAGQLRDVATRLNAFPIAGAPAEVATSVRDQIRQDEARAAADRALAEAILNASSAAPESSRAMFHKIVLILLQDLAEAPDAVRDRLRPFQEAGANTPIADRLALAVTGWLLGADAAVPDLDAVETLWKARLALQRYLAGATEEDRAPALEQLRGLTASGSASETAPALVGLDRLARLAQYMPPPLRDPKDEEPGRSRLLRARDDDNPMPTEYVVRLPPEYHPLRSYPTIVALHGGDGPEAAASWWADEAARRGYIVIAPEYNLAGQVRDYRFTTDEHAAVEIALRDARKRFAVDSNRVYLGGILMGGRMAWDYGLAHPDLFAGVAAVSGMPEKYVFAYKDNARLVPFYSVIGDLTPAEQEVMQPFALGLIGRNFDMTYIEYHRRGLEDFPEEAPAIFDWMDVHKREPYLRDFQASTSREGDDRFFGVVVREFAPGRTIPPDQVDPLGRNLKPATLDVKYRSVANILDVNTKGLNRFDLWMGPPLLDLAKKFEIRINGKTAFKGVTPLDPSPFLEDLRLRGDRQQPYWLRYAANLNGNGNGNGNRTR